MAYLFGGYGWGVYGWGGYGREHFFNKIRLAFAFLLKTDDSKTFLSMREWLSGYVDFSLERLFHFLSMSTGAYVFTFFLFFNSRLVWSYEYVYFINNYNFNFRNKIGSMINLSSWNCENNTLCVNVTNRFPHAVSHHPSHQSVVNKLIWGSLRLTEPENKKWKLKTVRKALDNTG